MIELKKWYSEEDPILREQVETLFSLLGDRLTDGALEGFLIVCSRFVDEFGNHRTQELANIFRTHCEEGKQALLASLEHVRKRVGGMDAYQRRYPVTVIPPRPAFPQFKIIGIDRLSEYLYRALNSKTTLYPTKESIKSYVARTGRLPAVPRQRHPVRRSKARFHWCSYEAWESPEATRQALQIMPSWNDCRLRAALSTRRIKNSVYVAFSDDGNLPENGRLRFSKYYYELLAQDHPPQLGGGPQIAVEGSPVVDILEEWEESSEKWKVVWRRFRAN